MTKQYLGQSRVMGEREPIQVYANLRTDFRDEINDPDRAVSTIEHEATRYGDVPFIAITWTYGTRRELNRGDGSGGAGIDADVIDGIEVPAARYRARRIVELAERWHLNTMRAGCAHQTVVYETDRYGQRRPSLDETEPCPETGYRYGHAWLVEIPPDAVLEELRSLFAESDTP